MGKRALIISGGGAYGSFAGGVSEYLILQKKHEYDIVLGTSTGSLLAPLLSINEVKKIKDAYLSVTQDDIFSFSPYQTLGIHRGNLRIIPALWNIIKSKTSIGDSSVLPTTIKKYITHDLYGLIKNSGKIVGCCVSNLTTGQKEYKYIHNNGYEDYIDWMHASCAVPPLMSVVEKNGNHYVDGAILEKTAIQEGINLGATKLDVIILSEQHKKDDLYEIKNIGHVIQRVIYMMMDEISKRDFIIETLKAQSSNVLLNIYYRELLVGHPLVFHPTSMKINWDIGYKSAKKDKFKTVRIKKFEERVLSKEDVS